jgi:hypothetical protein
MTTDPADRLTRAAARLRESDDPFRQAVADWLADEADIFTAQTRLGLSSPAPTTNLAFKVADVVLGESFQQAARDLADIKQDGEPEPVPDVCEHCGLPTPCVWCNA